MKTAQEYILQLIAYKTTGKKLSPKNVDLLFDEFPSELHDAIEEVRGGTHKTGIEGEYSRHYESEGVAAQMLDGTWVGWTYWFGGGKHGEPSEMPWIENAYFLDVKEVIKPVLEFSKK